jgi:hypothetical protein
MDEMMKAITQLINTGGALADDALYLYFALKLISSVSVSLTLFGIIWAVTRMVLKLNGKA